MLRSFLILALACVLFAACGDGPTTEATQPIPTVQTVPTVQPAGPAQPASPNRNGSSVTIPPPPCPVQYTQYYAEFNYPIRVADHPDPLGGLILSFCGVVYDSPLDFELLALVEYTRLSFQLVNEYTTEQEVFGRWQSTMAENISRGGFPLSKSLLSGGMQITIDTLYWP